jgi:futalosine hydrolase
VGKVNCAQAVTAAIEAASRTHSFSGLVSFGSAGAYLSSGLAPGDLVVASEEVADDLVVLPGRLATLEEIGLPLVPGEPPLYGRFPADPRLAALAVEACRSTLPPGRRVASGPLLTVSRITSARAEAERLLRLLGPILGENMEGAAAAQVARHYGLPFCELRAVANLVDDRDRQRWDFSLAASACCLAVAALIEALTRERP